MKSHISKEEIQTLIENPEKLEELISAFYEYNSEKTGKILHYTMLNNHLDEEMMNEALKTITRYDGVKAPFWTFDEFVALCSAQNISVKNEKYNLYDLNFLTQYYLADFKSQGKEPIPFINMAIDKLHDIDNPKACESAYWKAKKRICYYK